MPVLARERAPAPAWDLVPAAVRVWGRAVAQVDLGAVAQALVVVLAWDVAPVVAVVDLAWEVRAVLAVADRVSEAVGL